MFARASLISIFLAFMPALAAKASEQDYKTVDVHQAQDMIEQEDALVVLDVRTAEEFGEGRLPGAVNIDYYADDFAVLLATLPKDRPVLVYCKSGNRSGKTLPVMEELGFADVREMQGGWLAWQAAGYAGAGPTD